MINQLTRWDLIFTLSLTLLVANADGAAGSEPAMSTQPVVRPDSPGLRLAVDPRDSVLATNTPPLVAPNVTRPADPFAGVDPDRAVAVHAAGAVVFEFPANWEVREVPYRRDMRLAVAPQLPPSPAVPVDGLWLAYRYKKGLPREMDPLVDLAMRRIRSIHRGDVVPLSEPSIVAINDQRGVQVEFHTSSGDRRGFYLLVTAPSGHLELCATAPVADWLEQEAGFVMVRESLRLSLPKVIRPTPAQSVADAARILGSWKSYRGRLRLSGDGEVAIVTGRPFVPA